MSLCEYKSIFGNPSEGVHAYRIFGVAAVDLSLTILAAYFISEHFKTHFVYTLIVILLLGIVVHRLFCVNTTINKLVFGTV